MAPFGLAMLALYVVFVVVSMLLDDVPPRVTWPGEHWSYIGWCGSIGRDGAEVQMRNRVKQNHGPL